MYTSNDRDGFTLLDWGGVGCVSEIGQRDANRGSLALHMFDLGQHDYLRARAAYQCGSKEPPPSPSVTLLRSGVEMGSTGKGGGAPGLWLGAATDARLAAAMSLSLSLHMYVFMGSHADLHA